MSDVYRVQVAVYLELEGLGKFEVAEFSGAWLLNGIPSASCVLAVGRNAATGNRLAAIHKQGGKLTKMHKAKVYAKIVGQWNAKKSWPESEKLIFEGRLTGVGLRKGSGNIQFVAHLIHWISDIAFASTLSEQSHPTNPMQYSYAANYEHELRAQGGGKPALISQFQGASLITATNIAKDLWGATIQPYLCEMMKRDTIEDVGKGLAGVTTSKASNALSLEVLKRMEGAGGDCGAKLGKFAVPLSFKLEGLGGLGNTVAKAMASAISNMSAESWASTTMWDLLTGQLAPQFMFAVIPLVETAIVVPAIAGLRSTYDSVVMANEYEAVDLSGFIPRPLRGVGIYANVNFRSGARDQAGPSAELGIGGLYQPSGVKEGMFLFKSCPLWLGNIMPYVARPSRTAGVGETIPINSATTPGAGGNSTVGGTDGKTQGEQVEPASKLFDDFAHAIYINEVLRGRTGMLSGKLRFDIAPGSNIKIQGSAEQFIGTADALAQNLVGTVVRTSIYINAQTATASTGFQIAHIRTQAENGKEETSIANHPLYDTTFEGAPLVEDYKL